MQTIPFPLVLEQGYMLKTLGRIAVKSVVPGMTPKANPDSYPSITETLPAPKSKLVDAYIAWSGAPADRYTDTLPPHLFSQWALPVASKLLELTKYNLGGVLNQGCDVVVKGDIPRGVDIQVTCEMVKVTEENNRARVHQRLINGTKENPECVIVDFHTVFVLGKGKKSVGRKEDSPAFEQLGEWSVGAHDGLHFAVLTGDFNPIHWITPLAKLSPFKAKVLHGFGSFVRSWESIVSSTGKPVSELGMRFLKPVKLPSQGLSVEAAAADKEGVQALRLTSNNGKNLHLAGQFKSQT